MIMIELQSDEESLFLEACDDKENCYVKYHATNETIEEAYKYLKRQLNIMEIEIQNELKFEDGIRFDLFRDGKVTAVGIINLDYEEEQEAIYY